VQFALEDQTGPHGKRTRDAEPFDFLADLGENRLFNLPPEFDLENVERLAGANEEPFCDG